MSPVTLIQQSLQLAQAFNPLYLAQEQGTPVTEGFPGTEKGATCAQGPFQVWQSQSGSDLPQENNKREKMEGTEGIDWVSRNGCSACPKSFQH